MKKWIAAVLTVWVSVVAMGQKNNYNDPNAEVRNVGSFTGIKVSNGIELLLTQGNAEAVAVSAEKAEDNSKIKTEVKDGVLKIYFDNGPGGKWRRMGKLRAYVSVVTLSLLDASSGAGIKVDGTVKTNKLDLSISSGAFLDGAFSAGDIKVIQNSGARSKISGTAQTVAIDVSSGANFKGYDLVADKCNVEASSGASIEVTVNKELEAKASSGGSIRYKGSCVLTNVKTSSGGSIKSKA